MNKGKLNLEHLKILVIDEADEMLKDNFQAAINEIISRCSEDT